MSTKKIGPKGQKIEGNYTEYFVSTRSPKLRKPTNIKKMIMEEATERHHLAMMKTSTPLRDRKDTATVNRSNHLFLIAQINPKICVK